MQKNLKRATLFAQKVAQMAKNDLRNVSNVSPPSMSLITTLFNGLSTQPGTHQVHALDAKGMAVVIQNLAGLDNKEERQTDMPKHSDSTLLKT